MLLKVTQALTDFDRIQSFKKILGPGDCRPCFQETNMEAFSDCFISCSGFTPLMLQQPFQSMSKFLKKSLILAYSVKDDAYNILIILQLYF